MEERRKNKRYEVAYPVECCNEVKCFGKNLIDISTSGIAFIDKEDINKNKEIELKVFLKSRMFNVKAKVVYSRKLTDLEYIIGARLLSPTKEFKTILEKEIKDIKHLHRESNLHKHKSTTFKKTSRKYLESLRVD